MAMVGAQRAAELAGVSRSTIQRYIRTGKLSAHKDGSSRARVDVAELERVFGGLLPQGTAAPPPAIEDALEVDRLRLRVEMLEVRLRLAEEQIEDLKGQRDQWQRQATQVLLTSQHAQREAREYKDLLRRRQAAARQAAEAQKSGLTERVRALNPGNQNSSGFLGSIAGLLRRPQTTEKAAAG
ncbi:MAG TPA: entry exclusion 1 domain-containing protein [Rhodospirillaceae bacterium]|jgi:excisionase family DNA binding protein|nr:helix-turn-helix domain-containing protein [Alphaproteobacteria bacterium]HBH26231.1 entry exclusion 1 domain-containing protein [Rhodospirillaceae bacterium]